MIDVRDIIDVAVAVLTGDGHEGQSYILTGPAAISFDDVAATFSTVLGRNITYVPVPGEASLQSMIAMGFPEWVSRGFIELSEDFSERSPARSRATWQRFRATRPLIRAVRPRLRGRLQERSGRLTSCGVNESRPNAHHLPVSTPAEIQDIRGLLRESRPGHSRSPRTAMRSRRSRDWSRSSQPCPGPTLHQPDVCCSPWRTASLPGAWR